MNSSVLAALGAGYIPVILGVSLFRVWYDFPFWLAIAAILFLGAGLTLVIATFKAAPELKRRASKTDCEAAEDDGNTHGRQRFIAAQATEQENSG